MSVVVLLCERVRWCVVFFFQAEDGIRDLVRSRGLGDVYKRQLLYAGILQRAARGALGGCCCCGLGYIAAASHIRLSLIHI